MTAPYSSSRFAYEGTETTETSIVRTGGAVDPAGQAQSRKIVTTANAQWLRPFRCAPWAIWNETVGADVTVTVYGLAAGGLPENCDIWLDVEYLGDASSTLGSIVTTTRANVLASCTPVASDSSTWPTPSSFLGVVPAGFTAGWPGASSATAVWDAATSANVTLGGSGSALTVTNTLAGTSANQGARVADGGGRSSGKYYFELTYTTNTGGVNRGIGVGTITSTFTGMGGGGTTGIHTYTSGTAYSMGSLVQNWSIWGTGTECLCIDLDNRKFWYGGIAGTDWNNSGGTANPATNVGGLTIPSGTMVPFITFGGSSGNAGNVFTTNFGGGAFTPFKLVATLNSPQPGRPGLIHVRPKIGKASATFYLDPKIELAVATGPSDPSFSNVVLLMGFNGVDGSSGSPGFLDESPSAHGVATLDGASAQVDTAQSVFGGSSLYLEGTASAIKYADHNDWNLSNQPFTLELRIRAATVSDSAAHFIIGPYNQVPDYGWLLWHYNTTLGFTISTTGSNAIDLVTMTTLAANTWYAVAVDFDGTKYRLYINGVMVSSNVAAYTINNAPSYLCIGRCEHPSFPQFFNGWIDELRLTKGVARYASDAGYAVATEAFPRTGVIYGPPPETPPSNTHKSSRYAYEGTETTETSIVRTGGTAHSRKIVTTANSQWLRPYRAEPFAVWNDSVGEDVTVTVYGVVHGDISNTDEIWQEVEYLGDASSTLGTIKTTTKANVLASGIAVTSDASVWPTISTATFDAPLVLSTPASPAVGLSGGNLVVSKLTGVNDGYASSMLFADASKYYFEMTVGSQSISTGHVIGIMKNTMTLADAAARLNVAAILLSGTTSSVLWTNNATTGVDFGAAGGANFSFAVDLTNRLVWARKNGGNWNGNASYNPATGVGGFTIAAGDFAPFVYLSSNGAGNATTANFGATSYTYAAPAGFVNWGSIWSTFKLVATLNSPQPGQPGLINVRVKAAKPSSTFYIDPQPLLEPASSLGSGGGGTPTIPDPDVYDPATGDEAPVMQIAVDVDALSASFAANAISAHGTNPAGTTFSSNFWTSPSASLKYATPTNVNNFLFAGTYWSRDHALTGWCKNGEVFLRLVGGKAWSFRFNFEGAGGLTISLKEGITQTASPPGSSATATYQAYGTSTLNADIHAKIPAYDANDTEGHKLACIAVGLDLVFSYSLDGSSFTEIKRLAPIDASTWLHMADGAVAIANVTTYGWRDFLIEYDDNPSHLYSDFTETLDVRDFGVKDVQTTGSMTSGSPTLIVDDATDLEIGDFVIVDTTGATGAGAPGGRGPGGQWPSLRYPNQTAMAADLTKPTDTACSLEDTGYVWHFDGAAWQRDATWNPDYIYMHKSHPMALRAKIIAKSGTILTLNANAQVTVGSSRVYHDNQPLLAFLADTQDFHVDVPEVELLFPNSRVVMGAALNIQGHAGWSLRGAGSGRANSTPTGRTRFYAPLGCSTEINVTNAFTSVKDIHIDSGGYLDFPQVDAANMAQTTYGVIWPHGIVFTLVSNITVDNCNFTQPFQQAVAFRYCTTATVSNCTTRMPDPLGSYIQWNYQSANSTGIRFIDCELDADYMTCFCEPFQDDGTEYIRCIARNGISSNNTAVNTKYTDCGSILEALSRYSTNSQSIYNPVLQSNSNIGPGSPSTMTVDRFRYLLEGYVDVAKEQPRGVIMSSSAGSVLSNSNFEMLPYDLASALNGAQGVTCDSSDCTISSVRVDGTTVGDWAGNITAYDAANSGTDLVNCIADRQTNSQTGGTITGAQTVAAAGTDRAPASVSFTPVTSAVVGQTYTSNEITISGVNALLRNVTLTSNAKLIWLGNGVVPPVGAGTIRDHDHWVRKILRNGDKLKLQAIAAAGTVTVTLQLATGQSYNWTITA